MAMHQHEPVSTGAALSSVEESVPMRVLPASLAGAGILVVLLSAWAGIIPYVGPSFGFSADGAPSWQWSLSHAVLGLVPGAVGLLAGMVLLSCAPRAVFGYGRGTIALSATLVLLCGAWFVIGPFTWPVLRSHSYFVGASPLHELAYQVGYALGPGVLLAILGGFTMGWVARRQRPGLAAVAPSRRTIDRSGDTVSRTDQVLSPEA
ncbi:MAG: hypothetical protein JWO62_3602 [Acidimicrobiaceae bacterium]|jgi:hypothetical protein|nr:hypothetical protein [Acidimicrobiaceae bacterium]